MKHGKKSQYSALSEEIMDGHRAENKKWNQRHDADKQRQEQMKINCTKRFVSVPENLIDIINGVIHGVREGVGIDVFQEAINKIMIQHQNGNGA